MSCEFKTLLPHPSQAELALEEEMAQKYCRLQPDIIKSLHDPWACPLVFLPWLAYAYSVDVWNDVWPEATKRAVVANSIAVHTHKGTRGGIEDAMAALGVEVEITEWWEQSPPGERGTAEVTLWVNTILSPDADMIIGTEAVHDIIQQLNNSKRASIHCTFRLAVEAAPVVGLLGLSAQTTTLQRGNALQTAVNSAAQPTPWRIGLSGQLTALQKMAAAQQHAESASPPIRCCVGMSMQLISLHRLEMTL